MIPGPRSRVIVQSEDDHGSIVVDDPRQVGLRSGPGQGVVGNVEGHLFGWRGTVMRQREFHDEFGLDTAAARYREPDVAAVTRFTRVVARIAAM